MELKMLNPIEQSPAMAYEPARQQIMQHPQAEGAAAGSSNQIAALSTVGQVQQTVSSGAGGDTTGAGNGNSSDASQQQSNASQQLGAAWSTLSQLKHQAAAALSSGNISAARVFASEAAGIAGSIRDIVSTAGGTASAGAQMDIQEADSVTAETAPGDSQTQQGTSPLDLARSSLANAKDVVDSAMKQTGLTQADQSALISQQQAVVTAMAAVEAVAAKQSADSPLVSSYAVHSLVDIKA
jgi:hypothetical protein